MDPVSTSVTATAKAVEAIANAAALVPEAQVLRARRKFVRATELGPRALANRRARVFRKVEQAFEDDDQPALANALLDAIKYDMDNDEYLAAWRMAGKLLEEFHGEEE